LKNHPKKASGKFDSERLLAGRKSSFYVPRKTGRKEAGGQGVPPSPRRGEKGAKKEARGGNPLGYRGRGQRGLKTLPKQELNMPRLLTKIVKIYKMTIEGTGEYDE